MKIYLKTATGGKNLPVQPAGERLRVMAEEEGKGPICICGMDHWALDSCGIVSLFSFGRDYEVAYKWWNNKENTLAFIKFLQDNPEFSDGWAPKEYIFALAGHQFKDTGSYTAPYMQHLVGHPKVRRTDRFINKAHGPAHIYMFRLSLSEDFSGLKEKE